MKTNGLSGEILLTGDNEGWDLAQINNIGILTLRGTVFHKRKLLAMFTYLCQSSSQFYIRKCLCCLVIFPVDVKFLVIIIPAWHIPHHQAITDFKLDLDMNPGSDNSGCLQKTYLNSESQLFWACCKQWISQCIQRPNRNVFQMNQ
jgi:hypothetical protein